MQNSTETGKLTYSEFAGAFATSAAFAAAVFTPLILLCYRHPSAVAKCVNFVCCCRRRSNRIASSAHIRSVAAVAAHVAGVRLPSASSGAPPPPPPRNSVCMADEPEYLEAADLCGNGSPTPVEPPLREAAVLGRLSLQELQAFEAADPPLSGRSRALPAATLGDGPKLFIETKKLRGRPDSFKL